MRPRTLILLAVAFFSEFVAPSITRAQVQSTNQQGTLDVEESDLVRWLSPLHRDWLTEDVTYIITKEERWGFLQLTNDADRDLFIEQFWQRRNPDPESQENTFKAEHYRRIAYSNERFSTETVAGWKTDRGRIYIEWGQPDEIQPGLLEATGAHQTWRYRYLEGIGENVELEFVDPRCKGDYVLALPTAERDSLFQVEDPVNFTSTGYFGYIRRSLDVNQEGSPEFVTRFGELEAVAASRLSRNDIDFSYHFATVPVTSFTTLIPITIEVPSFESRRQANETDLPTRLNFFCRISNADGRIVETLEDTIPQAVTDSTRQDSTGAYLLQKTVPLRPGLYDVAIVLRNPESGNVGSVYTELTVSAAAVQK
jgi:GWxTD domain-containing protein